MPVLNLGSTTTIALFTFGLTFGALTVLGCNDDTNTAMSTAADAPTSGDGDGDTTGDGDPTGDGDGDPTGDGDGDPTGDGDGDPTGDGDGDPTGDTDGPGVPLVDEFDCANLPAAMQGADPLSQQFSFDLTMELVCGPTVPEAFNGAQIVLEYYGENGLMNGIARAYPEYPDTQVYWEYQSISQGTPSNFGATDIPWGETVTMTISDFPTFERTVEIVFEIDPPYAILYSITEI